MLKEALEKFKKNDKRKEWLECIEHIYKENTVEGYEYLKDFRQFVKENVSDDYELNMAMLKDTYTLSAPDVFDDYMIAMEWDKPTKGKFYLPRRKSLLPIVSALQDLADDKLDTLCISCPPGVGKTGVALFYLTWLGGRNPSEGILATSHNTSFLGGAYSEVLREISSEDYRWGYIFPGRKIVQTNAKDLQIAVDHAQRFPTFQFTSIGAGNAGKVRAVQLLYCDDLIEGIEEAMSKERLDTKWQKYTVDLKQRKQGDKCKELHIATRWSVHDIIGRIEMMEENNPRARFITVPALDENGKSNFDYGGSAGFTTEFYEEMRNSMDDVSFRALYMNQPIEREGLLYSSDELRRYYELPPGEPDAVLGVCDTATGGGDDTVLPIFYVYGRDHYLVDVVCSDALPETTDSLCASALSRLKVQKCQFESNSAGARTADKVEELVEKSGHQCHITKKWTSQNKETKIIVESDWIKKNVLFLDNSKIQKRSMYEDAVNKLCSYTVKGKNKHDDVPDAFAQYSVFVRNLLGLTVELCDRRSIGF